MRSEREKMLAGEPYDPSDPTLVATRRRARQLCLALRQTADGDEQKRLCRELFARGGDSVSLDPPFYCDYGDNIELGERVFFNFDCVILDVARVTIGSFTLVGPKVQIYTATHPLDAMARREYEMARPVSIGGDCWIGGGAIILPGVTIGDRAVIGSGSVVTRDVPSDVIAVGNPCRVSRTLTRAEALAGRPDK